MSRNFGSRARVSVGYNRGDDVFGHGSFVADVAAGASEDGRFVGIAPGATVGPVGGVLVCPAGVTCTPASAYTGTNVTP